MEEALLHELLAASQPEEKDAIVAEAVFSTLPEETALVAWCCCLFHWFDETIVEALGQDSASARSQWRDIYARIASLPFVESLPWGLAFNNSTRQALLSRYSASHPALLKRAAHLAISAYRAREADETIAAEAFFCAIVSGELTTALQLLDGFRQRATPGRKQKFFQGLRQLVYEAERLPFVRAATLRKAFDNDLIDLVLPSPIKETDPEQFAFEKPVGRQQALAPHNQDAFSPVPTRQRYVPASYDPYVSHVGPTVLVVDDSPTVRKIVQATLQREHIRVITASDGLSALTSVADEMPAIILLDIQLPRMDGYTICQIIRRNLQFRAIPIIMLSGKDGLFDKMRGRLAGTTEYLTKPFDSTELVQMVKKHLAGWQERLSPHTTSSELDHFSERERRSRE